MNLIGAVLCTFSRHKWERYTHLNAGVWDSGRKCMRCPDKQMDNETYMRKHHIKYGDTPMSQRQINNMKKQSYYI